MVTHRTSVAHIWIFLNDINHGHGFRPSVISDGYKTPKYDKTYLKTVTYEFKKTDHFCPALCQ